MPAPLEITPTSYPVSDFLAWQRQELLDLRPPYQRRSVWTKRAKSLLIDSLLRGYPIPLIFLHNRLDLDRALSVRQVVDGQQRIRTLLAYIDPGNLEDFDEEDDFTVFKSHNKEFKHLTFPELPDETRARLLETRLPTVVLPSGIPDVVILRIFQRLNSTGLRLNAQELRNAEFYGDFKDLSYALAYTQHQRWLAWKLFKPQQIAQMLEVEFTSDVLGLMIEGVKARRKTTIDRLYREHDESLDDADLLAEAFRATCDALDEVFGIDRSPSSLRRFRTTGWAYSCFAVLSNADLLDVHGGRRKDVHTDPLTVSPAELVDALQRADALLRTGELEEETLKTLRGATSDRSSRERRIAFIREQL
ncbi:MAG: DUF262 domain-containing protein [bacterium]|nr:DUF262 domain-containing protein [bacterium]